LKPFMSISEQFALLSALMTASSAITTKLSHNGCINNSYFTSVYNTEFWISRTTVLIMESL
jgi:hypothetical protein